MSQERRLSLFGSVIRSRSIGRAASWGASSSDDESKIHSFIFISLTACVNLPILTFEYDYSRLTHG